MTSKEILDLAVSSLDKRKAVDVKVLDIANKSSIADYFVVASGNSNTFVRALADGVITDLEEKGVDAVRVEGVREGHWIVIDYTDVIVHVFETKTRERYSLEKYWENKTKPQLPAEEE